MAPSAVQQARVKSVTSGDTLVLTSLTNPRQERTLSLAFVTAPRMRRDAEEAFAFASRDYLAKKLVGKPIQFQILYNIPTGVNRDYGTVTLQTGQKFPDSNAADGWVKVRDDAGRKMDDSPLGQTLIEKLESDQAKAKAESKGLWASSAEGQVKVTYDVPDAKAFADQNKGKSLEAVVERVITGDRLILRFLTSPQSHLQTAVVIAGIRAPSTKRVNPSDGTEQSGEPFGDDARLFLETRILLRTLDVQIVGVSPQGQLVCSIAHKEGGDMAGHILRQGLARCVDHHSTMLGPEMAKLRQAEKGAKEKKLNLFRDHVQAKGAGAKSEVTVIRVQTADTIHVRLRGGAEKRISLSSIRQPKPSDPKQAPFQAEAKEFLRKRLIGKHVKITVDGRKAASDGYEEREMATVLQAGKNVALELVEAGYATVIRHRRDDTDRSPAYDELLAAEDKATKETKGMHSGKPSAAKTYIDYSESLQKAKVQASVLGRQRKIPGIVDFVKGPSRFTVLVPRENAKLTLVLSCIRAPRSARNPSEASEPMGQEAHDFANRKCMQRDVEIDVDGTDKSGGFIGALYVNRENFARSLVEEGLATVHAYSAEQSAQGPELFAAESRAKEARKGVWKDHDPKQDDEAGAVEPQEGKAGDAKAATNGDTNGHEKPTKPLDYREVVITHVDPTALRIKIQIVGKGTSALEDLMTRFGAAHISPSANPLPKTVPPVKVGALVSARFSEDGVWYRARVRRVDRENKAAEVVYVDYGNGERVPWTELRALPPGAFGAEALAPQAREAALSFVQFPQHPAAAAATGEGAAGGGNGMNSGYAAEAAGWLERTLLGRELVASVDHEEAAAQGGLLQVTLYAKDLELRETESLNADAIGDGVGMLARKLRPWEAARKKVLDGMREREKEAKEERRGVWEYGDLTED